MSNPKRMREENKKSHAAFYILMACIILVVAVGATLLLYFMHRDPSLFGRPVTSSSSQAESIESGGESILSGFSSEPGSAFDALFEENPIDKSLQDALVEAATNQQLIEAYDSRLTLWKRTLDQQMTALSAIGGEVFETAKAEQEQWEAEAAQKIEENENETAAQGTNGIVIRAHFQYDLYRARARELCEIVYARTGELAFETN